MHSDAESWMNSKFFVKPSLSNLLLLSARELESEGKLDEALDRYLAALRLARHSAQRGSETPWLVGNWIEQEVYRWLPLWAANSKQEPERIAAALRRVEQESADFPPASDAVKIEYAVMKEIMALDLASQVRILLGEPDEQLSLFILERAAPWERARVGRVLDNLAFANFGAVREFESLLARPGLDLSDWYDKSFADGSAFQRQHQRWSQAKPGLLFAWAFHGESLVRSRIDTLTHRSACLVTLALLNRQWETGKLPSRLDDLPEYALQFTLDPWSGQTFGYLPRRISNELKFSNATTSGPLLWSVGIDKARVISVKVPIEAKESGELQRRVVSGRSSPQMVASSRGMGLAFPIPAIEP
jgi:hypothetical protein